MSKETDRQKAIALDVCNILEYQARAASAEITVAHKNEWAPSMLEATVSANGKKGTYSLLILQPSFWDKVTSFVNADQVIARAAISGPKGEHAEFPIDIVTSTISVPGRGAEQAVKWMKDSLRF